jgi:hypothetical protein
MASHDVASNICQALADGSHGERTSVLSHWHARLPGNPSGTGGGGGGGGGAGGNENAAAGNLGRRLCAALRMLPTATSESAAAATAAGWLAATCHVVLEVGPG